MYHVTPSYTPDQIDREIEDVEAEIASVRKQLITESASSTTQLATGDNLNNYTTGGTYCVPFDSVASGISNMPRSASGRLIVIQRTSVYITQFYLPSTSAEIIYVRNYNNGTWTTWKTIIISGSYTDISNQFTYDSTYVSTLSAYTNNNTVFLTFRVEPGTSDQKNVITNIASAYRPKHDVTFAPFYMNSEDFNKVFNALLYKNSYTVQVRCASANTGSGGVEFSGSWAI